ncbi:LytR/AlgR family response regulator transcription factor [Duganella lactea]|uniref:LytR/AlgR family response regulator transcription factor n=1 Tax=Duganella lactea TaxID=2692173 RepID=UPI001925DEE2
MIFVTAYDQHALRAFDVGALDYLLKPYSDERFHTALSRARDRLRQERPAPSRLVLKHAGQVIFLPVADIDWIGAADYYTSLHVGAQTHLLRRSLADLERDLDPAVFCRIHRSTIINIQRLQAVQLNADGDHEAVLSNGARLRISRTWRKALLDLAGGGR